MAKVVLSLGGNIGDVISTFDKAIHQLIKTKTIAEPVVSYLYMSKSLLQDEQPNYYNIVCLAETMLEPEQLLKTIKILEKKLGRTENKRWHERAIDIDIIDYDNIILSSDTLTLPHSQMHMRSFVILPMLDVAPDYFHPVLKKYLKEIYQELSNMLDIEKMEVKHGSYHYIH